MPRVRSLDTRAPAPFSGQGPYQLGALKIRALGERRHQTGGKSPEFGRVGEPRAGRPEGRDTFATTVPFAHPTELRRGPVTDAPRGCPGSVRGPRPWVDERPEVVPARRTSG